MSYAYFKQLLPPTGVEHCLQTSFTSPTDVNLIVAKTSVLDIYLVKKRSADLATSEVNDHLELVVSHALFGNVESLASVRFPGRERDSLLLSFRDAKVSVIDFNPELDDIEVLSLHCYEQDKLKEGHEYYGKVPQLHVDTQHRCAVMQIFDRKLVVLPFRQASVLLEMELGDSFEKQSKIVQDSFVIDLNSLGLVNVKDMVFLHGYHEPTLLVLYEPMQTWVGRVAPNTNTSIVAAVSLHLEMGGKDASASHPIIWSVEGLPWDSFALASVPAPIGGALVLSTNSAIYLNQSTRYGLSLNMFAGGEDSPIPLVPSKVPIALDTARFTFLAGDQLLVSLKGGELYILHLITDGRAVQRIDITKAGTSVLATCMCTLVMDGTNFLFIGSRLGDSLLIHYTESLAADDNENTDISATSNPFEPRKVEPKDNRLMAVTSDEVDLEDPYATAASSTKRHTLTNYKFRVCDSLLNIGPIAELAIGESQDPASISMTEYESKRNLEFVSCSGYGKHGSLGVLQYGIRPELVHASEELAGCNAVWTLHAGGCVEQETYHDYLLLSKEDRTMVLAIGEELEEISNEVDFNLGAATLEAGNVLNVSGACRVLQVHQYGLILLHNGRAEKRISVADEIKAAYILDPYVLLLVAPSTLRLFKAVPLGDSANLEELSSLPQQDTANTVAIHLFGGHNITTSTTLEQNPMCALVDVDGLFRIYTLPQFTLVFRSENICDGPSFMANALLTPASSSKDFNMAKSAGASQEATPRFSPTEVALYPLSNALDSLPYLFLFLSNDMLLIYKCYRSAAGTETDTDPMALQIRFRRCHHGLMTETFTAEEELFVRPIGEERANEDNMQAKEKGKEKGKEKEFDMEKKYGEPPEQETSERTNDNEQGEHKNPRKRKRDEPKEIPEHSTLAGQKRSKTSEPSPASSPLQERDGRSSKRISWFQNIGGRNGVFVSGKHPLWLIAHRGQLNLYEMRLDSHVLCFTPFHNVKCPHGFMYFNQQGVLKICQIPADILLEIPWAVRRIPLRCTPRHIAYHAETKSYAISVANTIFHKDMHNTHGIPFTEERHELRLFSSRSWKELDRYVLDEHEQLLSLKVVMLTDNYNQVSRRAKPYLVIGTASLEGEDTQCKGRVIIFEVEQSSAEDEDVLALRHLYSKAMKGPVSAINALHDYLLLAIGPKLILFNFDGISMEGVGFYDAQHYIISLNTMKNFVIGGDYRRALFFLRWRETGHSIKLVAKEHTPVGAFATEFLIDKQTLAFLMADERGNVTIYAYDPHALESRGGINILARGDFHVGARINAMLRLPMYLPSSEHVRHAVWFATLDGGVGYFAPVDEAVFRRQAMLQNRLITEIPHTAGLNPAAFRLLRAPAMLRNPKRTVLDGELLCRYLSLPISRQHRIASKLGTTRQRILNDQAIVAESVLFPL